MARTIEKSYLSTLFLQALDLGLIVAYTFFIWNALKVVTGSFSPIVVVLSGSMEPAFRRGDLLFLIQSNEPFEIGDIVVFSVEGKSIPIVHRVIETRTNENEMRILTKGDNNMSNDRGLYAHEQQWLDSSQIQGRVRGLLPKLGFFTILMNDYPWLKYALIGGVCLLALSSHDVAPQN